MYDSKNQRRIGQTDLVVPRFGLGTAPIGNLDIPPKVATGTIHYALVQGVTLVDTAPLYGAGLSESRLGDVLPDHSRETFTLSTKVGRLIQPDGTITFNYHRDDILRSLESSLERLKIDSVDIVHIHDPDNHYDLALNEAYPTLDELRQQGVIKAVGAGMNQWQMEWDFARNADFDCFLLAGRYTLLEQTSLEFLNYCHAHQIGIILGGVYNSGILVSDLTSKARYNYAPAPKKVLDRAKRIAAVCNRHNVPLHVAAIQFPLAHPAVTSIVVGAQSKEEIAANLDALQQTLPNDLWAELKAEKLLPGNVPVPE